MSELFGPLQAAGGVHDAVSDRGWVQAMLDAEGALTHALADTGLVPPAAAEAITLACDAGRYDIASLGLAAATVGNPAEPLVRALTAEVGGKAAGSVHVGATSQDILDTAAMLVARRASDVLLGDLRRCAGLAAALAGDHRRTLQVGRTLGQQAAPTTFGLTAAGWLAGLGAAQDAVRAARAQFAVQLGGAVGTLAALGADGPRVLAAMARRLDLAEPVLPWHAERGRIAGLAGALAQTAGAVARVARSIVLLAQPEVGELAEEGPPGYGGSSTLPHKRNPVAAVLAVACAAQAPGLAATLFAVMGQEHQRAAGPWHAEWQPLTDLLRSTGSAVAWLLVSLGRLRVHPERMRATLDATGGLLNAERVSTELAGSIGRLPARDAVADCCRLALGGDGALLELLAGHPVVGRHLTREQLHDLLEPANHLGSAEEFLRRALEDHQRREDEGARRRTT